MKGPPDSLTELVGRFDHSALDVPRGTSRVRLAIPGEGEWDVLLSEARVKLAEANGRPPDALLSADADTWRALAADVAEGMRRFRAGRLAVRRNLHLGVGFLAATSGAREPGRLEVGRVRTPFGHVSTFQAGTGAPLLAIHGLGGTKASFLPTLRELAPRGYRVVAIDLPGFGDSVKPLRAAYDAPYFARVATAVMDALGIDRAHLAGNSMGGRVALEVGLAAPDRADRLVLLAPSLAWLRERRWLRVARLLRPELALLQPAPRAVIERFVRGLIPGAGDGWTAAGVDEFIRAFSNPRGRTAFYAAARQIYLEEPYGRNGFWTRLPELERPSLFVWGRADTLVPLAFARHVRKALPDARHVVLACGHVPQVERPGEAHAHMARFLGAKAA